MCLHHEAKTSAAPNVYCIDGQILVKVGWAKDVEGDYPIYLRTNEMSHAKQKLAVAMSFRALRQKGFRLEMP